jgi:hypothetical protein
VTHSNLRSLPSSRTGRSWSPFRSTIKVARTCPVWVEVELTALSPAPASLADDSPRGGLQHGLERRSFRSSLRVWGGGRANVSHRTADVGGMVELTTRGAR